MQASAIRLGSATGVFAIPSLAGFLQIAATRERMLEGDRMSLP